jgi:hypothetical protein
MSRGLRGTRRRDNGRILGWVAASRTVVPQRCNIGPAEIVRRRRIAIVVTAATALVAIALLASGLPHVARLVIWPLATGAAVCWLQVMGRFCVRFGAAGVENFGALGGEIRVDPAQRAADARKAAQMILEGALIGLLATVAIYLLR